MIEIRYCLCLIEEIEIYRDSQADKTMDLLLNKIMLPSRASLEDDGTKSLTLQLYQSFLNC